MKTENNSIIIVDPQPELSQEALVALCSFYEDSFLVVNYEDAWRLMTSLGKSGPIPRCLVLPVHAPTIALLVFLQSMFELQVKVPIVVVKLGGEPFQRETLLVNLRQDFPLLVCDPSEMLDCIGTVGPLPEHCLQQWTFNGALEDIDREVRKKNLRHLATAFIGVDAVPGHAGVGVER